MIKKKVFFDENSLTKDFIQNHDYFDFDDRSKIDFIHDVLYEFYDFESFHKRFQYKIIIKLNNQLKIKKRLSEIDITKIEINQMKKIIDDLKNKIDIKESEIDYLEQF